MSKQSPLARKIAMRKTKATLVDMLEQQRQFIIEANEACNEEKRNVMRKQSMLNTAANTIQELEGKYEHLKNKHSNLNTELGRKDREIYQLKEAYIDKLEMLVEKML